MIKIGLLSDIHNHRYEQDSEIKNLIHHINHSPVPDLIVFAGDLSHRTDEILDFLVNINVSCPKCWIPGNHDIWVIDKESPDDSPEIRYREYFPALSKKAGWHYLPNQPFLFSKDTVALVGTIGWFTDNGYSEWYDSDSSEKDQQLALTFKQEVEAQFDSLDDNLSLILVSHHLIHANTPSILLKQGALWSFHMQELFSKYNSRIIAVLHGHVHVRYDPVSINGALFCAHPFGYPTEHTCPEDGYRIIEIDV